MMKEKLKTFVLCSMLISIYSCGGDTTIEGKETTDGKDISTEKSEVQVDDEIETLPEDGETLPMENETVFELEEKTYPVAEFYTIFEDHKDGLVSQEVTITGFYMNHTKQRGSESDEFEYSVTLFEDSNFERKGPQVFFIMKENNAEQFDGIKQGEQLTLSGVITDDDFFGAPFLTEGEIIK